MTGDNWSVQVDGHHECYKGICRAVEGTRTVRDVSVKYHHNATAVTACCETREYMLSS